MKLRLVTLILLGMFSITGHAQENTAHSVTFNNFSFNYDSAFAANLDIVHYASDDHVLHSRLEAYTEFLFDHPDSGTEIDPGFIPQDYRPELFTTAPGVIRVVPLHAVRERDGYQVVRLIELLNARPDLVEYEAPNFSLPYLPSVAAYQVIRARAQYVDMGSLSGISFMTAYRGGEWTTPLSSRELLYTFQGITADWRYYVSAIFVLESDLFASELPATGRFLSSAEEADQVLAESMIILSDASPDDFEPSLSVLDSLFRSFRITDAQVPVLPTASIGEGEGGMRALIDSNWRLTWISSADWGGDADPNVPITLSFTDDGINGMAGCNPYRGALAFEDYRLRLLYLETPQMECSQLIMMQEREFLHVLQTANSLELRGEQLYLGSAYGWYVFDPIF